MLHLALPAGLGTPSQALSRQALRRLADDPQVGFSISSPAAFGKTVVTKHTLTRRLARSGDQTSDCPISKKVSPKCS